MRIPQENDTTTTNVVCSEEELELEILISDAMEDLNNGSWTGTFAKDLVNMIWGEIDKRVLDEINWFMDKERFEVVGNGQEMKDAIRRLVGMEVISLIQGLIFPENK